MTKEFTAAQFKLSRTPAGARKLVYVGKAYHFDHPNNLSKFEMGVVLGYIRPSVPWIAGGVVDVLSRDELIDIVLRSL